MVAVRPPKQLREPVGGLLRILPLHLINLRRAGIAHRCDLALWRDGYEILRSLQLDVPPRELRE